MAKPNGEGGWIISAGEVGTFVVCPESWRLQAVARVGSRPVTPSSVEGVRLHSQWARSIEQAVYLRRGVKVVCGLLAAAVAAALLIAVL